MKNNILYISILGMSEPLGKSQVLEYIKDLSKKYNMSLYSFEKDLNKSTINDLAQELEDFGIKVHRLELSNKWNIIEAIIKLNKIYKNKNYDIVHAHLFFAHFYAALSLFFNKRIKKVVTFHNLGFNVYPPKSIIKKTRKKIEEILIKTFDKKTAVSKAVKEHYSKYLHLNDIKILHNSFPLLTFEKYKTIKKESDTFSVLTPGRIVKEKGHIYLIEAISLLNKKNYDINFYIIGDGPLKNEIRNQIKNISNIILKDALPYNELMKLYKDIDLIVIPSIHEAFGLVVGEAMIMETPIIATKVDGIVEMIEDRKEGLLVEPANPKALADAIEEIYCNKELRDNFVLNAKEKIKDFDTENIAKKWKKVYEDMLKR